MGVKLFVITLGFQRQCYACHDAYVCYGLLNCMFVVNYEVQ